MAPVWTEITHNLSRRWPMGERESLVTLAPLQPTTTTVANDVQQFSGDLAVNSNSHPELLTKVADSLCVLQKFVPSHHKNPELKNLPKPLD